MKLDPLILLVAATLLPTRGVTAEPPSPPIYEVVEPFLYFERDSVKTRPVNERNWKVIEDFVTRSTPTWVRISVHSDTAGPSDYNMALSVRRGEAVARRVVGMGVDPAVITIVACGELQQAVATGDGVDEPLNRRGAVDWGDDRGPDLKPDGDCKAFPYRPAN